jgi:hypothetical protein
MVRKRVLAVAAGGLIGLYCNRNNPYVILLRNASCAATIRVIGPLVDAVEQIVVSNPCPTTLNRITTAWLTFVFRKQGILDAATSITDIGIHEFSAGKTGKSARLSLSYSAPCGAPSTVVVKLSREDFQGIFLNLTLKLYREGFFYKHLAHKVPMPIPKCLYCNVKPFSAKYLIMLEDCSPTHDLTPMAGATKAFSTVPFDESFGAPVAKVEEAIMLIGNARMLYSCCTRTVLMLYSC